MVNKMLRKPELMRLTGLANSTVHWHVKHGLLPTPVKLSLRSSAWPEHEIAEILAARTAGADNDAVKALVIELTANRMAQKDNVSNETKETKTRYEIRPGTSAPCELFAVDNDGERHIIAGTHTVCARVKDEIETAMKGR